MTAIYKLWFMNFKEPWYALNQAKKVALFRMTEAYFSLPPEEVQAINHQLEELDQQYDSKALFYCFSAWSDEQWHGFLLETYPSQEAVQERHMKMLEIGWYKYARATSTPGVKWPIA